MTQVTDAGLVELAERLNGSPVGTLSVAGPGVTNAGVAGLRKLVRGSRSWARSNATAAGAGDSAVTPRIRSCRGERLRGRV